jgi:hypothetical protein
MTTEKQIEANKLNALKSTGPRTSAGKSKAALNSIKHGLRSQSEDIILEGESIRKYNNFYKELINDLDPLGPRETLLADRIINIYWKIKRITRMEKQAFTVLADSSFDNNPIIKNYRELYFNKKPISQDLEDDSDYVEDNKLGTMAVDNFTSRSKDAGRTLENIQAYESRIERSLYKAQLEFQKLQFIRRQKEAQLRNEPNDSCSTVALGCGVCHPGL